MPGVNSPALREAWRRRLLDGFRAALAAADGRRCVAEHLLAHGRSPGPCHLIAIGKAAARMAAGALEAMDGRIADGLILTKTGHCESVAGLECLEGGHPLPDAGSLAAGTRLLTFAGGLPPGEPCLVLLSGGASAVAEVLPEGITLADLQRVNAWLLGSGLPIAAMNGVRRALSLIKDGRLALRLGRRPVHVLLLSDVLGDDPAVIGSGPLAPGGAGTPAAGLPPWLGTLLGRAPPPPRPGDPCLAGVRHALVGSNRQALEAAARTATGWGLPVAAAETLAGDAAAQGEGIGRRLAAAAPGVYLWGGETTVRLPAAPGRGGRNQHLALAAAAALAGRHDVLLLAAGTDGTDGPTEDAGALVDGATVARGRAQGLDAARCLRAANAGAFLEASGDLLQTGPTGTNVMDLVIGLKLPAAGGDTRGAAPS